MKQIQLTKGKSALVDDADFDWLMERKWNLSGNGYAVTWVPGKKTQVLMHREIVKPPNGVEIDHINGNKIDNRRENLRLSTRQGNGCNRQKFSVTTSSVYKGVSWAKTKNRWLAGIKYNGKQRHLGLFVNEWDAALAYNSAAIELFGDFARLNVLANNAKINDTKPQGVSHAATDTQKGDTSGPAL